MSDQKPEEMDDVKTDETTQDSSDISSKLGDAQKAFMALKMSLDEEASTLMKERDSFEHMRRKLDVHFKKHIMLNVGGQIFKTSIETLGKDTDSVLASMFSGRFEVKQDEDGAYFIDRDGTHFRCTCNDYQCTDCSQLHSHLCAFIWRILLLINMHYYRRINAALSGDLA